MNKKQEVVIIGHGSTSRLGVVRSVAECGCYITVIVMAGKRRNGTLNTHKPFDCYSKYVNRVLFCPALDGDSLIRLLLTKCKSTNGKGKVIIIPDNDFSAATIDDNKDVLKDYFFFPHIINEPSSFRYWMDKENQKSLAREAGLVVSNSKRIPYLNGHFCIPPGIEFPCFTKAVTSISGGKSLFHRCDNKEELHSFLESIDNRPELSIMAENYNEIETEYAIVGFSTGNSVSIPGIIRFTANSASHYGIAMCGEVISMSGFDELLDKFRLFIQRIGFVGLFDIDFYYCKQQYFFSELNLRFGGSGYAITKMGVNLPAMLIRYFQGEDICKDSRITPGVVKSFVNERICNDDWYKGYISNHEYNRLINMAEISFVKDRSDPKPQLYFNRTHVIMMLRKWIKHF
jgi:predicted ATP-grasp superfamily ATP-dependent carboligase